MENIDQNKIIIEKHYSIGVIYLNDPDRLNPLSHDMKKELLNAIMQVGMDNDVRIVIIAGKGKAFSAGGDINSMRNKHSMIDNKEFIELATKIIKYIYHMDKPVIAAVNGYVAGAGFSIALASDMIIAEKGTQFLLSFKKLGLIPDLGLHYFLPRIVEPWQAKKLIWSAGKITALEGYNYGFVTEIADEGDVLNKAFKIAEDLANGPMQVYYHSKRLINKSLDVKLDDILEMESYVQTILKETEDHDEGVNSFINKNVPDFMGK